MRRNGARSRAESLECYRAFTLVEIVVVIAILLVLLAILAPVYGRARRAGNMTSSMAQLHQIYQSMLIYQEGTGGSMAADSYEGLGLPSQYPFLGQTSILFKDPRIFISPCGAHPDLPGGTYSYYPDFTSDYWINYVKEHGTSSIVVTDMNCTDHNVSQQEILATKTILGLRLDGSASKRVQIGNPWDLDTFWH